MGPDRRAALRDLAVIAGCFGLVLLVHAALPFVAMPTLGQALWLTGFGESFARGGFLNLYAHNFGAPLPAPIAFGLPGALPAGWLIAAGLHPGDAYALVLWLWLGVAFWGALRVGRLLGLSRAVAAVGALVWLTLPIVWNHAHYSMLSMGFALLPTYFAAPLALIRAPPTTLSARVRVALHYLLGAVVALFMDGYTFIMFAVAASLWLAWLTLRDRALRPALLRFAWPLHLVSLALAGRLYSKYVGGGDFHVDPMEAFRGWGLDLRFLLLPSRGVHGLFDAVGFSEPRTTLEQFGDESVWQTTYLTPLLLIGAWAWWRLRRTQLVAPVLLAMALFGGWMALGPSVKFHHTRPVAMQAHRDPVMQVELAGPRTGTSLLSKHLPGFRNMRASYRWMGLCALGFWLLALLWLAQPGSRWRLALFGVVVLLNLPEPIEKWRVAMGYRDNLRQLDAALLPDLRASVHPKERLVFLPFGNDFIINYLASRLDVVALNIGGDKNLAMARAHWPPVLQGLEMNRVDPEFSSRVARLLADRTVDAVVLPHFDMLWAAHHWPCGERGLAKCPPQIAADLAPMESQLQQNPSLAVVQRPLYVVVRRAP